MIWKLKQFRVDGSLKYHLFSDSERPEASHSSLSHPTPPSSQAAVSSKVLFRCSCHKNKCVINHVENISRHLEETTFVARLMFFLFGRDRKGRKMRWLTVQRTWECNLHYSIPSDGTNHGLWLLGGTSPLLQVYGHWVSERPSPSLIQEHTQNRTRLQASGPAFLLSSS